MPSSSSGESRIFFPWEGRGGVRRFLALGRMRQVLVFGGVIAFVALIGVRERRLAGIRETRATLLNVRSAVQTYMAENEGGCPETLDKVVDFGSFKQVPPDAWGRPLRLICPARHGGGRFELLSDGPDGEPLGLDRIE